MESKPEDSIQVCIRIRPDRDDDNIVNYSDTQVAMDKNRFCFDRIFPPTASQDSVFDAVGLKVISHTLDGYNGCIFVYGQTGSGKTYTMMGQGNGLMQKSFISIFSQIQSKHQIQCLMTCSYYQIYNEQIIDLLDTKKDKKLNIRQDSKKGVFVENLTEQNVYSSHKLLQCLNLGMKNRHVGQTMMNRQSSRSHSIFTISLAIQTQINGIKVLKSPKLHFVDLAGSQRQKMTAASGDRLKQAGNINKSLTTLGMVINALTSQRAKSHIPYRDSKLTSLLRDSLGGNSKTFLIATISRSMMCFQETLSTLNFANRAKMVKVKALINQQSLTNNIQVFKQQIRKLKAQVARLKSLKGSSSSTPQQQSTWAIKPASQLNYDNHLREINNKISSISQHINQKNISPSLQQIIAAFKQQNRSNNSQQYQMQQQYNEQQMSPAQQTLLNYLSNNTKILQKVHQKISEYNNLKQNLHQQLYSQQMYIKQLKTPSKFERDQYQQILSKKTQKIDQLHQEIYTLKSNLLQNQQYIQQLQRNSLNNDNTLQQKDQELAKYQQQKKNLKKQLISLKNLQTQNTSQLQNLYHKLQETTLQLKQTKQLYVYAEQNYKTQKNLKKQIQTNLYAKLAELQKLQSQYSDQLIKKQQHYQQILDTLRDQLSVLESTVEFNQKKIIQLHQLLKQSKQQNNKLSANNHQLSEQTKKYKQKSKQLQKLTAELQNQKNTINIQLINTQLQLQNVRSQYYQISTTNNHNIVTKIVQDNSHKLQVQQYFQKQLIANQIIQRLTNRTQQLSKYVEQRQHIIQQILQRQKQLKLAKTLQITKLQWLHSQQLQQQQQQATKQIQQHLTTITNLTNDLQLTQQNLKTHQINLQATKQQLISTSKQLRQQYQHLQTIKQKIQQQRIQLTTQKTKVTLQNQQLRKNYNNIVRDNYRLKNRYTGDTTDSSQMQSLAAKVDFYEQKFKLMTIDYKNAEQVLKKAKNKQINLQQKIAYLQQKLKLSSNTQQQQQQQNQLLNQNKALKAQLTKLQTHVNQSTKNTQLQKYQNKLQYQNTQKLIQDKQMKFKQKLIKLLSKSNPSKQNNQADQYSGQSLDQLIGAWEQLENQNFKQLQAVTKGIKKQQKLRVQNNLIYKENIYLKQKIGDLQKQLSQQMGRPRKLVKLNTQINE